MIRLISAFAVSAILAASGAGSAMAAEVEIDFGNLTPSPNGCTVSGADSGYVCTNPQFFSAFGNTFTAIGFDNPFNLASGGALTLKPLTGGPLAPPANPFAESGLGENTSPPGTPCTSADCAIDRPLGVAVLSPGSPMNDAIIGSVGEGDTFNFFTGSSITTLSFFGMFDDTCPTAPAEPQTCLISFPDAAAIAVQTDSGSVLITAVSENATTTTPEPASLALLGAALVGFAVYRGDRRRRRRLAG